jgi:hypothetical protein
VRWIKWAGAVVALVVLFFVHPYLFGLPGRINEHRFENGLRVGMSVDDLTRLATDTHADVRGGVDSPRFTDKMTLCDTEGDSVVISFDNSDRVRKWFVDRTIFSCWPLFQPVNGGR